MASSASHRLDPRLIFASSASHRLDPRLRIESPSGFSQQLDLPQSVERELRGLLQQDRGELTDEVIKSIEQQLASRDQNRDSNEDDVGELSGCAIVADAEVILRVVLEGLRQRLRGPASPGETLRFT